MRVRTLDLVLAAACASCGGGGTDGGDSDATGVATASVPETGDTGESTGATGSSTDGDTTPTEAGSSETAMASTGDDSSSSSGSGSTSADSTGSPGDSSSGDPPPPANLFENPSLEDWPDAAEPNTPPAAWTDCSSGGVAVDAVPDSCDAMPATASEGERYARGFSGEGIAQTIATTVGTTYAIEFDYCGVDACFGGTVSSTWEVLVDGVVVLTTDANVGTSWTAAATTFEAAAATTTICLRKASDGGQGGLDNLVLHEE